MIIAAIINAAAGLPFLPQQLEASDWAVAIRAALIALLLFLPALIVVRETLRVGVGGTAVQLSEHQYPDLYQTAEDFARRIGLRRRPQIFLTQRQRGTQRVRRASDRPRLRRASNELFANLYDNNRNGLRFILGHELGHIRFHHVALWYQLAVAYSQRIPLLGPALSRLREYSSDGQGAALSPQGATGLVLLASGRYTENAVDLDELVQQGRELHGFWVGLTQLPRSHPFTVRRLERLHRLDMFATVVPDTTGPSGIGTPNSNDDVNIARSQR